MKPLPASLSPSSPESLSPVEQPASAAACPLPQTFLSSEPSTMEAGLWAVQNLSPTLQCALKVLTAFLKSFTKQVRTFMAM